MGRFILRRLLLGLVTLFLLSIIVFVCAQVLPGDVGRSILGPFADQKSVDQLNQRLGTDRSVLVQYWDWISGVLTGDLGQSIFLRKPVTDAILDRVEPTLLLTLFFRYMPELSWFFGYPFALLLMALISFMLPARRSRRSRITGHRLSSGCSISCTRRRRRSR